MNEHPDSPLADAIVEQLETMRLTSPLAGDALDLFVRLCADPAIAIEAGSGAAGDAL